MAIQVRAVAADVFRAETARAFCISAFAVIAFLGRKAILLMTTNNAQASALRSGRKVHEV